MRVLGKEWNQMDKTEKAKYEEISQKGNELITIR